MFGRGLAAYAACFGIEVTINNMAALYFTDYFKLGLFWAGMTAGLLGMLNIFARALGGIFGDLFGGKMGAAGPCRLALLRASGGGAFLDVFLADESPGLGHSRVPAVRPVRRHVVGGNLFGGSVHQSQGPGNRFRNRGSGGNAGAVAAGFLFKSALDWPTALLIVGGCVALSSLLVLSIRFVPEVEMRLESEPATIVADGARELLAVLAWPARCPRWSPWISLGLTRPCPIPGQRYTLNRFAFPSQPLRKQQP